MAEGNQAGSEEPGGSITLDPDPIKQFGQWLADAETLGLKNPNSMTLATATADGVPSARMLLLKSHGADGFAFFTNYDSPKAGDLEANPRAELVFFWDALERQVRVSGPVRRVSREESVDYFGSRPRGSQLAGWASEQSRALPDRRTLVERYREVEQRYEGEPVPCPPFWGGYRLLPEAIEFWIGKPDRLHDRFRYGRKPDDGWTVERLAP